MHGATIKIKKRLVLMFMINRLYQNRVGLSNNFVKEEVLSCIFYETT